MVPMKMDIYRCFLGLSARRQRQIRQAQQTIERRTTGILLQPTSAVTIDARAARIASRASQAASATGRQRDRKATNGTSGVQDGHRTVMTTDCQAWDYVLTTYIARKPTNVAGAFTYEVVYKWSMPVMECHTGHVPGSEADAMHTKGFPLQTGASFLEKVHSSPALV